VDFYNQFGNFEEITVRQSFVHVKNSAMKAETKPGTGGSHLQS
jgi:hypothetical protein